MQSHLKSLALPGCLDINDRDIRKLSDMLLKSRLLPAENDALMLLARMGRAGPGVTAIMMIDSNNELQPAQVRLRARLRKPVALNAWMCGLATGEETASAEEWLPFGAARIDLQATHRTARRGGGRTRLCAMTGLACEQPPMFLHESRHDCRQPRGNCCMP